MTTTPHPDVLICGAGPVGLTLATQLIRHDVGFRIIEKSSTRTELSKALGLFARSLELLHTGIDATEFVQAGIPIESALIFANGGELARVHLAGAPSRFGTGVLIPQPQTERVLEESLAAMGTTVERTTELTDFDDLGDRVRCTIDTPTGKETIEPKWLVGCDGAHSICRHRLGLEFKGETDHHRWLLADVRIKGAPTDASIVNCLHPGGFLVAFRIREDHFRLVAEERLDAPDQAPVDPTLQEMQTLTDTRGPGGWQLYDPQWLSEFRINERKVDHYGIGRVFLAGDSAHVHSPAGGQGMNTGMQDACNLAWKIALATRGVGGAALIESYSNERSEVGRKLLRNTGRMTRMITLKSRLTQGLRNTAMRFMLKRETVQHSFRDFLSELSIAYPDGPITGTDRRAHRRHAPRTGHRMPDLQLQSEHGDDCLHDLLADPRISIVLHTNTSNGLEYIANFESAIPHRWRNEVQFIQLMSDSPHPTGGFHHAEDADIQHTLGLAIGDCCVVRPDGYIALYCAATTTDSITRWLESIGS